MFACTLLCRARNSLGWIVLGFAEMLNNLTSFLAIECNSYLLQQGNSANHRKNHTFSYRYQDITVCVSYPVMAQQSILEDLIASLRVFQGQLNLLNICWRRLLTYIIIQFAEYLLLLKR